MPSIQSSPNEKILEALAEAKNEVIDLNAAWNQTVQKVETLTDQMASDRFARKRIVGSLEQFQARIGTTQDFIREVTIQIEEATFDFK